MKKVICCNTKILSTDTEENFLNISGKYNYNRYFYLSITDHM